MFLAMVSAMDDAIGKVVNALALKGILHNTLIVFTSDVSFILHRSIFIFNNRKLILLLTQVCFFWSLEWRICIAWRQ